MALEVGQDTPVPILLVGHANSCTVSDSQHAPHGDLV